MVSTRKMESRIEGCDSRLNVAEKQIEQIGSDVNAMKDEFASLRIFLTDFVRDFKEKDESRKVGESSFHRERREEEHMKYNVESEEDHSDFSSFRKLDMPLFSGEDPLGWIFRVERYFKVNRVVENEKIDAAVLCFENRALNWFQWREVRSPIVSWRDLKQELLLRFHSSQSGSAYEMLMALRQTGGVMEYIEKFELLSATLDSGDEEMMKAAFMNGLRRDVKADLRLMKLETLAEIMDMAVRIEERDSVKLQLSSQKGFGTVKNWSDSYGSGIRVAPSRSVTFGETNVLNPINHNVMSDLKARDETKGSTFANNKLIPRKYTDAEIERRRELGLCFKCDERFKPGHRCKRKQLQVLILSEGDEDKENMLEAEESRRISEVSSLTFLIPLVLCTAYTSSCIPLIMSSQSTQNSQSLPHSASFFANAQAFCSFTRVCH